MDMKQNKRRADALASEHPEQADEVRVGCQRTFFSQAQNGINRSLGTSEKDPTVHPESPRNNPNPC